MVEAEANLLSGYGIDLTDLRKARAAREQLQVKVDALPKTVAAMVERRDGMTGRLSGIEQRIFRLNLELEGFRRILAAVDTYVAEQRTAGSLSKEETDFFQLEVPVMREIITELERESVKLTRATERRKDAMGLGVDSNSEDARLRAQYLEVLVMNSLPILGDLFLISLNLLQQYSSLKCSWILLQFPLLQLLDLYAE